MSPEALSGFPRYLAAKAAIDDRSLSAHVWAALAAAVDERTAGGPLEVVEIGAGIGTMVERLLARGLLAAGRYTAVDVRADCLERARERLPPALRARGYAVAEAAGRIVVTRDAGDAATRLEIAFVDAEAIAWLAMRPPRSIDLVVAHAVLDEVDVDALLAVLATRLRPGGLLYASLCYDGLTALEPMIDADLDARIAARYHATMDARRRGDAAAGDSRAGRRLFARLRAAGFAVVAAGGSDWVVFAGGDGYPGDEAFFLHYLLGVMDRALQDDGAIAAAEREPWIAERRAQLERGELVWIAHDLDLLARAADG